jgi:hypothetical protein
MIRRHLALLAAAGLLVMAARSGVGQPAVIQKEKLNRPVVVAPGSLVACFKPDLTQWQANLPLGASGEFAFEGQCKQCWTQIGVQKMVTMSMWIENKGMSNAPASKAKLSWTSGKPPYGPQSVTADIPALTKSEKKLLQISVPAGEFFQIAKPITLELDSLKQVDECREDNNIFAFNYN